MEKFPQALEFNSNNFLLPKGISQSKTLERYMIFANSRKKKILKTIRNLFQFFSMLIEACLLKGLMFYKSLLKLPQERQEDTVASYLLPELLWLLPDVISSHAVSYHLSTLGYK